MKRLSLTTLATVALSASMVGNTFAQQTTLRVFSGGQNQRPDLMRKLFDEYQKPIPMSRLTSKPVVQLRSCSAST